MSTDWKVTQKQLQNSLKMAKLNFRLVEALTVLDENQKDFFEGNGYVLIKFDMYLVEEFNTLNRFDRSDVLNWVRDCLKKNGLFLISEGGNEYRVTDPSISGNRDDSRGNNSSSNHSLVNAVSAASA